jgi:hypothetical protein
MKPFFDLGRLSGWRPKTLPFLLAFVTMAAGCGKSGNQAAVPPPPTNSVTVSATPAPAPAPAPRPMPMANPQPAITTNSGSLTTLQVLNRAMISWMRQNHRRPQSFEEFASTANIQIPAPPPGKKYGLNPRGFIILVDSSTQ